MRIKKLVSAFSALAITVTAIAGLAVTASAAETAFSQNFTGESTDPADYGFIKISEDTDTNIPKDETEARTVSITSVTDGVLTNSCFMGSSGGGRGMEYAANFTAIGAGNEVTVQYTWNTGSATGNKTDAYSDTYLADSRGNKIFELRYYGQDKYLWLNGKSVANGVDREGSYNVSVTIDMNTKKITSLSVGNAYSISDAIDFYSSDANDVARFGFIHRGRASWINTSSIDNIVITYEAAKAPVESVSVQYKTADGAVIETVSLDSLYKLDKEEYQKVALGTVYVGDTCYIPWQKYIFKDGVLYETTRNNSNPHYGTSTAITNANFVFEKTVSVVTPAEGTEFIAVVDGDGDPGNSASIRASNMSAARGDITLGAVEPGVYSITYSQYIRGGNPQLYLDDTYVCDLTKHEKSWGEATTENIVIDKAGTLVIKSVDMTDHIRLIKTGEYIPPAAEATEVTVEGAEGVTALKVDNVALTSTSKPVWTITATDGQEYNETKKVNAAAQLPTVDSTASLGLIVDNIPDEIDVTATLSY